MDQGVRGSGYIPSSNRRPLKKSIRVDTEILQSVSNMSQEHIVENGKASMDHISR